MATFDYNGYTVLMEQNAVNGSIQVSAIPDHGPTLRHTFYGHGVKEVRAMTKNAINNGSFD